MKRKKKQATMVKPAVSVHTEASAGEPNVVPTRVRNPPKSSTKGRKKDKRFGSAIELRPKKTITCGTCGLQGHNGATCSARFNQSL